MSKSELKDKIAIVTGGGRGIGKGIALEYAKAGANVVVASRNRDNLEEVAAEVKALGRESLVVVTDVTIPEQVDNMVKETVDRFGRIDILVNNAGVGDTLRWVKVEELSAEAWRATIDLNLTGTFLCGIAAAKVMIAQKSGKIVNISSVVGIDAVPKMPDYSASKAGVINLTMSMATEWAQHNINVNSIAPARLSPKITTGMRRGMPPTVHRCHHCDSPAAPKTLVIWRSSLPQKHPTISAGRLWESWV